VREVAQEGAANIHFPSQNFRIELINPPSSPPQSAFTPYPGWRRGPSSGGVLRIFVIGRIVRLEPEGDWKCHIMPGSV
jgi:hypothetical protein